MNKLSEIYSRNVEVELNGVVSTGDTTAPTVQTEINEYVFTVDIVNGLYKTLEAIKNGSVNHNGVWVSGYFGSGKSHFLKYVSYCLRNAGDALARMADAVKEHDPLSGGKSAVTPTDWADVSSWFAAHAASVRTIMFNMGESGDSNVKDGEEFLTVFWRKFNEMRGYSSTNLALAHFLERPLDKGGKFADFKAKIAEKGYNWEDDRSDLAGTMLDTVLDAAKAVMPELTTDAIRENIINNRITLSVASFMSDVKEWLATQGADSRIVFCVDEISQYISNRSQLLLQLQEIVTAFHNETGAKVWLVCTAQQDLSDITSASGINQASEEYGKIMGRFPVMVQLPASSTEFITRKRVLAKTPSAAIELGQYYDAHQNEITAQYEFPAAYPVYTGRDDFIDTYPFLGCHFRLMGQVLRAFRERDYVVQNVKNNARSVLTITLDVARETRECSLGKFVAFDEFFNQKLKNGLTALADSVIQNARALVAQRPDPKFAERVLNVLFMICHLSHNDAQQFPATIDNLTSLLMDGLEVSRKTLRDKIEEEVNYLCEKSVLMRETDNAGNEHFKFYTKLEAEIDSQIKSLTPGPGDFAEEWESLVTERLGSALKAKVNFHATKVSVGMDVLGRRSLSNGADVNIDVRVNSGGVPFAQLKLNNPDTTLVFFVNDLYNADTKFRDALDSYCRFNLFSRHNALSSPEEKAALEVFRDRAKKLRTTCLVPAVEKFLLDAPIASGPSDITTSTTQSPSKRFEEALQKHLENLYPKAAVVESLPHTAAALAADVTGYPAPLPTAPLADAEQAVEDYLVGVLPVCPVTMVVDYFRKRPFGWDEYATLAVLNHLVVAERRQFTYNGAPNPTRATVAANIAKNTTNFSISPKTAISQQTVDSFLNAIRDLFGHATLQNAKPQATELATQAKEFLSEKIDAINAAKSTTGPRPFVAPLDALATKFSGWKVIADVTTFFETVAAEAPALKGDWDTAKNAMNFAGGNQWQKYLDVLSFAASNAENVQFLDAGGQAKFTQLETAKDCMVPWSDLPSFIQLKKQLEAAFNTCRTERCAKIDTVYSDVFNDLETLADNLGVPHSVFADRAATIAAKKAGGSLMALENAINDAPNFKAVETQKIIAAQPQPTQGGTPSPTTETGEPQPPAPVAKPVKCVHLKVTQTTPLKTEAEVDSYMAGLKAQLMVEINAGSSIVVQ